MGKGGGDGSAFQIARGGGPIAQEVDELAGVPFADGLEPHGDAFADAPTGVVGGGLEVDGDAAPNFRVGAWVERAEGDGGGAGGEFGGIVRFGWGGQPSFEG